MLAAIMLNLQDGAPAPKPKRPELLQFDMGGGGALGPRYEIADYLGAISSFREMHGEHPVVRAARRTEHIGRELVKGQLDKDALERAMAWGVLAGAQLERMAAAEQASTTASVLTSELEAKIAEAHREIAKLKARAPEYAKRRRLREPSSSTLGWLLVSAGVIAAVALTGRRP